MPCSKCKSDFNVLNWKQKCYECEDNYCSRCLKKVDGGSFCETCEILIKRPPVKTKLMELKSKDLQQYLNKHNISTRGIVEKQELVELFYRNQIPVKDKKRQRRFACNLTGSVPNLAQRSQTIINNVRSNAQAVLNNRWQGGQSAQTTPVRSPPVSPERPFENYFGAHTGNNTSEVPPNVQNSSQPTTSQSNPEPATSTTPEPSNHSHFADATEQTESSPRIPKKYPKLSDFKTLEDINELSVKQLKELLSLNRVDYKGCVEKAELLERVNRLWIDANLRKEEGETIGSTDELCKICMDAPLDCVLLECGHMATCIECGKRLAECPICRQYVTRVVRTFKA